MKRWLPTLLALAFVSWIIFLADAGYAIEMFSALQDAGLDKVGHFALIGMLAYFLNVSLGCRTWRGLLLGSAIVFVAATAEEISQVWIENRHCDLLDLAADYAGIWLAGWLARRWCGRSSRAAATPRRALRAGRG
jgi:VanZ family protein